VRQVDPASGATGKFRVLVQPDEMLPGEMWPDQEFLRQGNQAVGWVFLNRVSLGFELWRRLNGFPPEMSPIKKGPEAPKPPKIKVK
jgi:hypothetical protein